MEREDYYSTRNRLKPASLYDVFDSDHLDDKNKSTIRGKLARSFKTVRGRIEAATAKYRHHFERQACHRFGAGKVAICCIMSLAFGIALLHMSLQFYSPGSPVNRTTACMTKEFSTVAPSSTGYAPPLPPPEPQSYRTPDTIDTFNSYKYRNHSDPSCRISSLDLHLPFSPLCTTRPDVLRALSGGGRIGFDAPFIPRGCDMRWFATEEICDIFSRFEKIIVVGDSMMRHVVGSLNVLLRKDLGYGAVTQWNFNEEETKQCFCNRQLSVKGCSVQGIFTTSSVLEHDPESLACDPQSHPFDLIIEMMLKFPLDPTEVARFQDLIAKDKPRKPYAFIFGHGLWNDLDLQATVNWLDGILDATKAKAPYLKARLWPRLFVSPNAAGVLKPDQWITSQGDKALQIFEEGIREQAMLREVDHLGTWNMSIQASKYDGVHLDLKGNLIKAMSVINWLSMISVETW